MLPSGDSFGHLQRERRRPGNGVARTLGSHWAVAVCWHTVEVTGGTADPYERFGDDRVALAQIGKRLFQQSTRIEVRLPSDLARLAVDAWARDETDDVPADESSTQRSSRDAAANLALIGLAVHASGVVDGDEVLVSIDAWQIGAALSVADDQGLLAPDVL